MAGRIRGAVAVLVSATCLFGCVYWRPAGERSNKELSRTLSDAKPLDRLQVTAGVAPSGQLLLELRRACAAKETVVRRIAITERAEVRRVPVFLAVGGVLIGGIGGAAGTIQDESGATVVSIAVGALLVAPLVYAIVRKGSTRDRAVDDSETHDVEAACEDSDLTSGAAVKVTTPWGAELSATLRDEGMVVLDPVWQPSDLQVGAQWTVSLDGLSATWGPDQATVSQLSAALEKRKRKSPPAPKQPAPKGKKRKKR